MLLDGLTWVATGAVVGFFAQFFAGGRGGRIHASGIIVSIVGAVLGGLVSTAAFRPPHPDVLMSVVGAGLALICHVYALGSFGAPVRFRG
jgi:uncharacterized membrane protein YeaQ/YmgE (transglycosylase-associated protein family)